MMGSSTRMLKGKRVRIKRDKPPTAEEINAKYDRWELDLRTSHYQQLADLQQEFNLQLHNLREERAKELAEAEERGSGGQKTSLDCATD